MEVQRPISSSPNKLIKSLSNGKALSPNNIPNKVFKIIALIIAKDLAKVVSYCFINKTILKGLKEFIIMVLRKEGKKDYSF